MVCWLVCIQRSAYGRQRVDKRIEKWLIVYMPSIRYVEQDIGGKSRPTTCILTPLAYIFKSTFTGIFGCRLPNDGCTARNNQVLSGSYFHVMCQLDGLVVVSKKLFLAYLMNVVFVGSSVRLVTIFGKIFFACAPSIRQQDKQEDPGSPVKEDRQKKILPKKLVTFRTGLGRLESHFWKCFLFTEEQIQYSEQLLSGEHSAIQNLKHEALGVTPTVNVPVTVSISRNEGGNKKSEQIKMIDEIGQLQARCNGKNVVRFFGFWSSQKFLFQIFERQSFSLRDMQLKAVESFSEDEVRKIVRDVLQGLRVLHGLGVAHRDINMSTILYMEQNDVYKIGGFEKAKECSGGYDHFGQDLTMLAVVVYELLSNTRLFSQRLMNGDFTPIHYLPGEVLSAEGKSFLTKLLGNARKGQLITVDDLESHYLS